MRIRKFYRTSIIKNQMEIKRTMSACVLGQIAKDEFRVRVAHLLNSTNRESLNIRNRNIDHAPIIKHETEIKRAMNACVLGQITKDEFRAQVAYLLNSN